MFEYAARNKLRFQYYGTLTAEDLWDLDVKKLDEIYKSLNAQRKIQNEDSLLAVKSKEDKALEVRIGIVRHIVTTKLAEAEARSKAKENRERRQHLMNILADKQEAELRDKSSEELMKMIEELEEE